MVPLRQVHRMNQAARSRAALLNAEITFSANIFAFNYFFNNNARQYIAET
jgi:hypothetical protein